MPRARPLRDGGDGVPRLDAHERDALVVVENAQEARHAELVRDVGELGERLGLQVVRDAGRERGHAGARGSDAPSASRATRPWSSSVRTSR